MDSERASVTKRKVSVLQGDEFFFNKVISRNSSIGYSSRLFYYRSSEGVPFQWEVQPGTPKDPPKEEILPPLSLPPAVHSLGLPKPNIHDIDEPKVSIKSRLKFWKHIKKIKEINKLGQEQFSGNSKNGNAINGSDNKFESSEFRSTDNEFIMSSINSSFSSSSSSSSVLSFSNGRSSKSSRLDSSARGLMYGINGCSPWKFNSVLLCVAKRD